MARRPDPGRRSHLASLWRFEAGNHALRKIAPDGQVSTLAGGDLVSVFADGQGGGAKFLKPKIVASDAAGNVFMLDQDSYIRKITPTGSVTTVANIVDDNACREVGHLPNFCPKTFTVDASGTIYFMSGNRLHRLAADGRPVMLLDKVRSRGVPTPAFTSPISPSPLVVGSTGDVYIADFNEHVIRKVSRRGEASILAGRTLPPNRGPSNDSVDGQGAAASFARPIGMVRDELDNLYVLEADYAIRKVTSAGVVTTLRQGTRDFPSTWAYDAQGSAGDVGGNFYFSVARSTSVNASALGPTWIVKIDAQGAESVYAGSDATGGDTDGVGSAALLSVPRSPAMGADGNLLVLDQNLTPYAHTPNYEVEAGRVRRISPSGATTTLVIEQNSIDAMAGMATDKQSNAYVGVGRQIRAIASNGSVTPFFIGGADLPDGFKVLAADAAGAVYAAVASRERKPGVV